MGIYWDSDDIERAGSINAFMRFVQGKRHALIPNIYNLPRLQQRSRSVRCQTFNVFVPPVNHLQADGFAGDMADFFAEIEDHLCITEYDDGDVITLALRPPPERNAPHV